jgi:hypothetical protein
VSKLREIFNHRVELPDGSHADAIMDAPQQKKQEPKKLVETKSAKLSPDDIRKMLQ